MIERSMIEIKCPKCYSEDIDCYDTEFDIPRGLHWDFFNCLHCNAYFDIKYIAVEIESRD